MSIKTKTNNPQPTNWLRKIVTGSSHMKQRGLTLLLGLSVGICLNTPAATYYVAKNGDDGNPGTEARPWASIQKAASTAVAGDTVLVKAGTYDEKVRFANGGTENASITYKPSPNDEVIISYPAREDHVVLFTKPYIVFEGFKIVSEWLQPIRLNPGSHHVTIKNCELIGEAARPVSCPKCGEKFTLSGVRQTAHGLVIESDAVHHVTIQNCRIHGHGQKKGHHGLYIKGDHHLIEGNIIYNNAEYGIHLYNNQGSVKHCVVRNNILYGNGADLPTGGSGIIVTQGGHRIHNNVCCDNGRYGIIVWQVPAGDPPNEIHNNVLHGNGRAGLQIEASSRTIARNNICSDNKQQNLIVLDSPGTVLDHNCYWPDGPARFRWGSGGARTAPARGAPAGRGEAGDIGWGCSFAEYKKISGQDAHGICADPRFVNAIARDFRLRADSPCLHAGAGLDIRAFEK